MWLSGCCVVVDIVSVVLWLVVVLVAVRWASGTLAEKNCSFAALLSDVASLVGCWNSAAGSKISQSVETWQLAACSLFAALLGAKHFSDLQPCSALAVRASKFVFLWWNLFGSFA